MTDSSLPPFDETMDVAEENTSTYSLVTKKQNIYRPIPEIERNNETEFYSQNGIKQDRFKYGELIILGYNGQLPKGDRGRRRSKLELYRRAKPNGIMKSRHYNVSSLMDNHLPIPINDEIHSIRYRTKNDYIVVEYCHDENTDLFQIGRSSESPIDFVVMDTIPGNKIVDWDTMDSQPTISRFACRILANRDEHNPSVKIFAAGFNSSKKIFLGAKATIWETQGSDDSCIHGLTTNGILIMKPSGVFCQENEFRSTPDNCDSRACLCPHVTPPIPGTWREISVDGSIFGRREPRSAVVQGVPVPTEDNYLTDGALIDLCGATLLWRSSEGISRSPTEDHLKNCLNQLHELIPHCPKNIFNMIKPRKNTNSSEISPDNKPFVFLNCGHVQTRPYSTIFCENVGGNTCPKCNEESEVAALCMGEETSFYVDLYPPEYCFVPCGHMASEQTALYWATTPIPSGASGFYSACPFCATPLDGSTGYVKLIFLDMTK